MNLPVYLPLAEAATKYKIPMAVLTRLVQDGKIEAVQLADGEVAVSDKDLAENKTKEQIIAERFAHLVGQPITISEAVKMYRVPDGTLRVWISRGYIQIVDGDSYPMKIDEVDIAYCAYVYHDRRARGAHFGAPLLDEEGRPYALKRPELSEYRRKKREQKAA